MPARLSTRQPQDHEKGTPAGRGQAVRHSPPGGCPRVPARVGSAQDAHDRAAIHDEGVAFMDASDRQRDGARPAPATGPTTGEQAASAAARGLMADPSLSTPRRLGRPTEDEMLLKRHELVRPEARDFTSTDPWRVLRITSEFVEGFDTLAHLGPAVSIFGSARVPPASSEYRAAEEVARRLAHAGFTIIT